MTRLACVVLNFNDADNVIKLYTKIRDYKYISEIVIVDNCSTDNSFEILKSIVGDKVSVIKTSRNGGYGFGNNEGLRFAFNALKCDYVLIANPDVDFSNELVLKFVEYMENNNHAGVVSAIQKDVNGNKVLQSAWRLPRKRQYIFSICKFAKCLNSIYYSEDEMYSEDEKLVGCVAGSLLCISKKAFELSGGYDENVFLYCEETILGLKLAISGLKTVLLTDCSYLHLHGVSIGKTFKKYSRRQKLLNISHHYVVSKYFKANFLERCLDSFLCFIRLVEAKVIDLLKK